MQYLIASDLHYALPQLDWIAEQAPGFDAVILAGDHLDIGGYADLDAQIALLTAYLAKLADVTTVIANSGNHDLTGRRAHGEKAAVWLDTLDPRIVTDGGTQRVGPDLVSACAWWEGDITLAAVEHQLELDAARRPADGAWIWGYHSPPDDSPTSWSGSRHFGDDVLNRLIDRHAPDVVIAGHVHESPFKDDGSWHDRIGRTLVLNAGRHRGPIPAHIVLDTTDDRADWWSAERSESLPL